MKNDNIFDLIIAVVFSMSTQLGGIGPKYQDLVISFCLGEGETLPQFHLRDLQIRSDNLLLLDKKVQINNPTGKYITELSKLKFLQRYTTQYEIYHRKYEHLPQSYQLSTTFTPKIEEVFETPETADIDMIPSHSIIEPIVTIILEIHPNIIM